MKFFLVYILIGVIVTASVTACRPVPNADFRTWAFGSILWPIVAVSQVTAVITSDQPVCHRRTI